MTSNPARRVSAIIQVLRPGLTSAFAREARLWLLLLGPALAGADLNTILSAQGQTGVTVSVADIMARDAVFIPASESTDDEGRKEREPRLFADRKHLRQDPDSPAVAEWPPRAGSGSGSGSDGGAGGGGTVLEPRSPQVAGVSFLAAQLSESGFIPPDTQACVSPDQILVVLNGRIKVFDKRGTLGALNTTTDNFFSTVTALSTTDPRVRFDRLSGRWFIVMVDIPSSKKNNHVLLAVSSGPVISGTSSFTFFSFAQNTASPSGDNNLFADYPTLGVDSHALYIGANMFSSSSFSGTTGFVVNKANLINGTLTVTAFRRLATATQSGPYTPQGVDNDDPNAAEGYFIGVDTRLKGRLVLRRVTNPGGAPTISANINITVPTTVASLGGVVAQGVATPLDDLDDRLFQARLHNGSLWTAHNIEVNSSGSAQSGGGRDGSRWYEIVNLTGTPSLRQSGTLFDPSTTSPASYWMPSCAMSGQGHMALGCSVAGATEYAEIAVAGRFASDPLGTLQSPTLVQASSSPYDAGSQSPRRWGDYSVVVVDPGDDMTLWTAQEYCNATDSWGVRMIELRAPPPATPTNCNPSSLAAGSTNASVVVSGGVVNGSGFFDPGPSFPRHMAAVVNGGGVTVNSVTYTDPTHVTLHLSVAAGAAAGSRTISLVNPDGQIVTSASTLFGVTGGNSPPSVSSIAAQAINEDATGGPWDFTVNDAETPAASLTVSARSSNTNVVPDSRILLGGSGGTRTVTVAPATNQFGSATITITVTDSAGATATSSFVLTVNPVNDPPSFVKGADVTVPEDFGPQTFAGWATAIDPGAPNESSQTLTFIVSNDNPTLFASQPAISSTGTLTFTSALNANGSASVSAQLFDNGGTANGGVNASAPQTFTVTLSPVNDPPVAVPQTVVTDEDTAVAIVLAGSDVEGDPLTFAVLSGPVHGALSGSGASRVYRPNNNYFGADSFTFKVNDGNLDSAPATVSVTINPVNDPPTAFDLGVATAEDTSVAITLTGSDPEGDPLSFSVVSNPANGTLSGTPPNLTYLPATNFFGTDSFDFKVNDGSLDSPPATVTVTVNAVNDPPALAAVADQTVVEGDTLTITNAASDVDLPVQTLTFSLDPGAPEGATIDPTNGVFTWTPTEAQGPGANPVTVRVTDGGSPALSATRTFTVIVLETNSPPVLAAIPELTASPGQLLTFTVGASDPDIPANGIAFSLDPGAPAGAAINPTNGVFTWTPPDTAVGTNTLTVRATDDGAPPSSDTRTMVIVVAAGPVIESVGVAGDTVTLTWSAVAGRSYQVQFKAGLADADWTPLAGDVPATGATATKTDSVGTNAHRFYRVALLP